MNIISVILFVAIIVVSIRYPVIIIICGALGMALTVLEIISFFTSPTVGILVGGIIAILFVARLLRLI